MEPASNLSERRSTRRAFPWPPLCTVGPWVWHVGSLRADGVFLELQSPATWISAELVRCGGQFVQAATRSGRFRWERGNLVLSASNFRSTYFCSHGPTGSESGGPRIYGGDIET